MYVAQPLSLLEHLARHGELVLEAGALLMPEVQGALGITADDAIVVSCRELEARVGAVRPEGSCAAFNWTVHSEGFAVLKPKG